MTRLMMAMIHGDNLEAMTTFNKGKGKAPTPPPMIAPAPPVEEASVEIDDNKKKRALTSKSRLKMPIMNAANVGLKGTVKKTGSVKGKGLPKTRRNKG